MTRGRPTSWATTHAILLAVGRGIMYRDIAAELCVSQQTIVNLVDQYGLMCNRERKPRKGSLTLDDRVEIAVGIGQDLSFAEIGR